ncbi:MAG: NAD(P)/FAD-dependent oxidoreductase [Theionarchaea archaeon]|nr:NAD(P)/FAD-dependent oxidoreductase [Theionarchaea archaeon]MBU7038601.1 NAD(P)/FAD-dependent oxidoreductase [Theionarchaea archaeon]
MIVIGGGIGGLLVAALCPKVTLFERTSQVGGRFRNIPFRGFQLTTGALHMVPHGSKGPLAQLLKRAGAPCTIVDSNPLATFFYDKEMRFGQVLNQLKLAEKTWLYTTLLEMRYRKGDKRSFQEFLEHRTKNEIILRGFRSFCIWSLSLEPSQVPCREMFSIVKSMFKYRGPGVPMGGCSGVIRALKTAIRRRGNAIVHKRVTEIVADDKVYGVVDEDGKEHTDSKVVSDIGAKATSRLVRFPGDYQKRIDAMTPSEGIKYSLASKEPLIDHSGVMFTPALDYIGGINQVTNVDPSLAPEGYHLVMAHQRSSSREFKKEKEKGLSELEKLFDGRYEILNVQTYRRNNPVNHAASGQDLDQMTPIEGLYLVGDSAKGEGGIEVEGIALGVERLLGLVGIQ